MSSTVKHYLILNFIVLIWGFTGVLGDQMQIESDQITFFRMGLAFISLFGLSFFFKTKTISRRQLIYLLLTGGVVSLHWYLFFLAIRTSTVSIGVVCMSSSTLFTAIIEPLVFKKKHLGSEFLLGFGIIGGILLIFGFEPEHKLGIFYGLISALLASLFSVLNGKHIQKMSPLTITMYEMLGGFFVMGIFIFFSGSMNASLFNIGGLDWIYLLILSLICTTFAFMVSVWIMKFVSPFTVSLSINMEPVYAIIIALIVGYYQGTNQEKMSVGFYLGTAIILAAIFTNAYLKKQRSKARKLSK